MQSLHCLTVMNLPIISLLSDSETLFTTVLDCKVATMKKIIMHYTPAIHTIDFGKVVKTSIS